MARINRQAKLFQRRLEVNRNRIEMRGRKTLFSALDAQNKWFLKQAAKLSPKQLLKAVEKLPIKPMEAAYKTYYKSMAQLPLMYHKELTRQVSRLQKSVEDERLVNEFEKFMEFFLRTEAAWKVVEVNKTTKARLVRDIQGALRYGEQEGWGIERISEEILKNAKANLGPRGINRARVIAQTEIISGSNQSALHAADKVAKNNGMTYRKFWSNSGLPATRDSHIFAENWSVERGGIKPNQRFSMGDGTYMLSPGDSAGGAKNVINCRCSVLFEMVVK